MPPTADRQDRLASSRALAAATLDTLAEHGLAPTPGAFRVWYLHLAGGHADLSRAVGELLARCEPPGEERCAELARQFLDGATEREQRACHRTCARLEEITAALTERLAAAGRDAATYGSALRDAERALFPSPDPGSLGPLLGALLRETAEVAARSARLERELRENAAAVTGLRRDLLDARREARTDGLTGAANRKQLDAALAAAAAGAAARGATAGCLLLADVDHFKLFNDRHGHQMGDHVLRLVSAVLRREAEGRGLVARFGGEEFAVLLPSARLDDATALAERIREAVGSRQIVVKDGGANLGRVTLSIGATDHLPGESAGRWVERADEALYAAKNAGRNRVVALPATADAAASGDGR